MLAEIISELDDNGYFENNSTMLEILDKIDTNTSNNLSKYEINVVIK